MKYAKFNDVRIGRNLQQSFANFVNNIWYLDDTYTCIRPCSLVNYLNTTISNQYRNVKDKSDPKAGLTLLTKFETNILQNSCKVSYPAQNLRCSFITVMKFNFYPIQDS